MGQLAFSDRQLVPPLRFVAVDFAGHLAKQHASLCTLRVSELGYLKTRQLRTELGHKAGLIQLNSKDTLKPVCQVLTVCQQSSLCAFPEGLQITEVENRPRQPACATVQCAA
jgi:hypothetical protein